MRILCTEKQRENLAKFFWDMAKVALTFFVIAPFAQAQAMGLGKAAVGLMIAFILLSIGYILDGRRVKEKEE